VLGDQHHAPLNDAVENFAKFILGLGRGNFDWLLTLAIANRGQGSSPGTAALNRQRHSPHWQSMDVLIALRSSDILAILSKLGNLKPKGPSTCDNCGASLGNAPHLRAAKTAATVVLVSLCASVPESALPL